MLDKKGKTYKLPKITFVGIVDCIRMSYQDDLESWEDPLDWDFTEIGGN